MNTLIGDQEVVLNNTPANEGSLVGVDHSINDTLNPHSQQLSDYLIGPIEKTMGLYSPSSFQQPVA